MIIFQRTSLLIVCLITGLILHAQMQWTNVDSLYQPLPSTVHVYRTNSPLDGKPNIAYYLEARLDDKHLEFTTDTTTNRRLTPQQFYEKDGHPLVIVNTSFFSYATNQSLNVVIRDGKLLGYNVHTIYGKAKDTFTYRHPFVGALGINKKRKADVAWVYTDSSLKHPLALQHPVAALKDSAIDVNYSSAKQYVTNYGKDPLDWKKWKMETAVGGGPVLLQAGEVKISNNEEMKFGGKAIDDKHPRTTMGYTADGRLIILVIQGRFPNIAEGASLTQEAIMLKELGCVEAINLDGGGSSCLLVNGKETIKVSESSGQRPVPAIFLIRSTH